MAEKRSVQIIVSKLMKNSEKRKAKLVGDSIIKYDTSHQSKNITL
jgi:hypothetical protein